MGPSSSSYGEALRRGATARRRDGTTNRDSIARGGTVGTWRNAPTGCPTPPSSASGSSSSCSRGSSGRTSLRDAVPIWIVFAIALGLELQFLVAALRAEPSRRPDRRPQTVDRDRFGYEQESDDLLLLREGDEEVWLALSGRRGGGRRARRGALEPRAAPPTTYAEPRPRTRPVRRFLVGLGLIGALVLAIWFVESRTGWDSLDRETRIEADRPLRGRGVAHRREAGDDLLRRVRRLRRRGPACGRSRDRRGGATRT